MSFADRAMKEKKLVKTCNDLAQCSNIVRPSQKYYFRSIKLIGCLLLVCQRRCLTKSQSNKTEIVC